MGSFVKMSDKVVVYFEEFAGRREEVFTREEHTLVQESLKHSEWDGQIVEVVVQMSHDKHLHKLDIVLCVETNRTLPDGIEGGYVQLLLIEFR